MNSLASLNGLTSRPVEQKKSGEIPVQAAELPIALGHTPQLHTRDADTKSSPPEKSQQHGRSREDDSAPAGEAELA